MPTETTRHAMTPVTGSIVIDAPRTLVFDLLAEPRQQARWNSLYLSVDTVSDTPVLTGSRFSGHFKGSGAAEVTFERVNPGIDFVHLADVAIFGRILLGRMRHTYAVSDCTGGTHFSQAVEFMPSHLGRPLTAMLRRAFAKRLPESFDEFRRFVAALSEVRS